MTPVTFGDASPRPMNIWPAFGKKKLMKMKGNISLKTKISIPFETPLRCCINATVAGAEFYKPLPSRTSDRFTCDVFHSNQYFVFLEAKHYYYYYYFKWKRHIYVLQLGCDLIEARIFSKTFSVTTAVKRGNQKI